MWQADDKKISNMEKIRNVCVLGAGVMGQAISAHMINCGINCLLLDLPSENSSDRNAILKDALKKIHQSKPSLIFDKHETSRIEIGNFEDDLAKISQCDLVIEAVVEKVEVKQEIYRKIQPFLGNKTIVASNTSGLAVEEIIKGMDKTFCSRFLVMHFFNPVRYLHLVELIPSTQTQEGVMAKIRDFANNTLGKGVVTAKDTTNFIANRIGVYFMMECLNILKDGYSIEEIDTVFGPSLGRPKSAIFRTADVVGLDTFIHVAKNCYDNLSGDEKHELFAIPPFLTKMVEHGWLGQKAKQGFYKKEKGQIYALDTKTMEYKPKAKVKFDSLYEARKLPSLKEKLAHVAYSDDKAGQLFFLLTAKGCIYSAKRLFEISDSIFDIDNALKWGFGWEYGPFEIWDAIGLRKSVEKMKSLGLKIPSFIENMLQNNIESFYKNDSVYCPKTKTYKPLSKEPKEIDFAKIKVSNIVHETDSYSLIDTQRNVLAVEFHSKMNAIDNEMLEGINKAIDICESGKYGALLLANKGANFSVGANLFLLYMAASQKMWSDIESIVKLFQSTSKRLRYCSIPTIAAPFNLTLGGGCELSMWCDTIHAQAETYMGLVEVGVGLIPGGGGNIAMLARTLEGAIDSPAFTTEHMIQRALETVAMAKVATSVKEAKNLLYMSSSDTFSVNPRYFFYEALQKASFLSESSYTPPFPREFRLPGTNAFATFNMGLRQMLDGNFISEHDFKIAMKVAHVMTGGKTCSYNKVSEDYLLDLEREAFLSLLSEPKTMERIAFMLEHNKPLRN